MADQTQIVPARNGTIVTPAAGTVARDDFQGTELTRSAETAGMAAAEQARALVEARYIVAMKRPRDIDQARTDLLKACRRPTFAAGAIYAKPIGKEKDENGNWVEKFARGPSIRFVEEALRAFRNVDIMTSTIYDDPNSRIIRQTVSDIESGIYYSVDVKVEKTVERSNANGRIVLSSRKNSYNKETYLVVATEDELLTKAGALISKAIRENGRRILPGDIVEEALEMCKRTMDREHHEDPDAARKRLVDAFAAANIPPTALKEYLGHDIGTSSPAEFEELRAIYSGIRDGETSWNAVMEAKRGAKSEEGGGGGQVIDSLKERLKQKTAKKNASKGAPPPPAPASGPAHDEDGVLTEDPPVGRQPGDD